jgi:hypothetical protein
MGAELEVKALERRLNSDDLEGTVFILIDAPTNLIPSLRINTELF